MQKHSTDESKSGIIVNLNESKNYLYLLIVELIIINRISTYYDFIIHIFLITLILHVTIYISQTANVYSTLFLFPSPGISITSECFWDQEFWILEQRGAFFLGTFRMIGFIASSLLAVDMYFRIQYQDCWKSGILVGYWYQLQ